MFGRRGGSGGGGGRRRVAGEMLLYPVGVIRPRVGERLCRGAMACT